MYESPPTSLSHIFALRKSIDMLRSWLSSPKYRRDAPILEINSLGNENAVAAAVDVVEQESLVDIAKGYLESF